VVLPTGKTTFIILGGGRKREVGRKRYPRMTRRLFLAFALLAACGDKTKPAAVPPTDLDPPPVATTAIAIDAGIEAPAPLPARSCSPAHAATIGQCSDGLRCVLLLEISDACIVKVANEIELPDGTSESDGAGIEDIAWPKKDGSLFLVNRTDPTWSWAALPAPLTAKRDALATVAWTRTKVGETEPEGFQYGLTTDGTNAYLAGCKKWGDDCGADAEECEEWFCKQQLFIDPLTKKKLAKAPALPFVKPPVTGAITDTVTLAKKGKKLTCAAGGGAAEEWYEDPLDGSITLSSTDWFALRYRAGSRMKAHWDADADYMRGCGSAPEVDSYGSIVVGPNQLWARSTDGGWELQHGPVGAPLTDGTGKIKAFGDSFFVFATE
jgi:hypothetical protein